MPEICICVRNKFARPVGKPEIVCGNADYLLRFDLDAEWTPFREKTARFFWYDQRREEYLQADVLFSGNTVQIPVMRNTHAVAVGIYAGSLHSTAPVRIPCLHALTEKLNPERDLPPERLEQLLSYLRAVAGAAPIRRAEMRSAPVPAVRIAVCAQAENDDETRGNA
ncbi:MAG: hypothetical protein IKI77_09015 [Oscillospiraceae bacterium]|nr:hypothetical protein [Oscillospiraceae bacterium]